MESIDLWALLALIDRDQEKRRQIRDTAITMAITELGLKRNGFCIVQQDGSEITKEQEEKLKERALAYKKQLEKQEADTREARRAAMEHERKERERLAKEEYDRRAAPLREARRIKLLRKLERSQK